MKYTHLLPLVLLAVGCSKTPLITPPLKISPVDTLVVVLPPTHADTMRRFPMTIVTDINMVEGQVGQWHSKDTLMSYVITNHYRRTTNAYDSLVVEKPVKLIGWIDNISFSDNHQYRYKDNFEIKYTLYPSKVSRIVSVPETGAPSLY